jgi:DNA-binding GntR family transcriptional regulator
MNEKIYEKLKEKILYLELQPGETIDEKKMAIEFKVSRTPIREILQKLEWEGLVDIIPRGVISVATLEYNKIKNTYFMRVQIEGLAGKLAAAYGKPKHVVQMESLIEKVNNLNEKHTARQLIDFDSAFREILYEAACNTVLKQVSDNLYEQTIRIWLSHIQNDQTNSIIKKEFDYFVEEIQTAIDTIQHKNREKAEKDRKDIIIRHIKRANEYFMQDIQLY